MNEKQLFKDIGSRVRTLRKQHGYTQEKLAEIMDLHVDTISNIERGFASTRIKTAARLAEVFDVELVDLFPSKQSNEIVKSELDEVIDRLLLLKDEKQLISFLEGFEKTLRS